MVKLTRKLKQELTEPKSQDPDLLKQSYCALQQKLSCCDGVGYRLNLKGAYTQASLCDCVSSCKSCFGRVRRMVDGVSCPCRTPNPSRIVNILNMAGIPSRYGTAKLDKFSNFTGNGREILQAIAVWLREFSLEQPKGLLLGGPVGVGKTFLLSAIAKNFAARGLTVRFVDFFQLLNELKAAYSDAKSDANVLKPLINVDVLIIDEMGKGRNSDWEMSILDQVVMGRYNQNKIVVASTNYDLKPQKMVPLAQKDLLNEGMSGGFNLDSYEPLETRIGQRIYSRLVETCMIMELSGNDFRRQFMESHKSMLKSSPQPVERRIT
ncbi:ATP-binding protein [Pseudobacteriovorax antillogorgiicola]|uniref:DNA replication protein DnaC n=1 Tax=Pseudobacteriovorax antillogorgiicola TaxID=1513793 RepID=A0A1Y6C356_9BACT|nr:ATP-binding protein [Pseudobacteriovorax antillogorgiicola]TCS50725.1 DNA replication protein DnaC [Pseudobacteriovorax antillogorgiicola]SMF40844.1 DNA replication protein DnaC [Pseudobacteriovorax antillogorgiicola]